MTWVDVEKVFELSAVSENPVRADPSIGLTPISPVIAEVGIVSIPDFAKMTKSPAVPSETGKRTDPELFTGLPQLMTKKMANVIISAPVSTKAKPK